MTAAGVTALKPSLRYFKSPQTVIGRFVAKRTIRASAFLALAFGVIVASKAAGFAVAYPTEALRAKVTASFTNNIGLNVLLGRPIHLETVRGFTTWNTLGVMVIIGSIWAFLLATKTFRGEEDNGRSELLLTGQTTARRAAVNTLAGLGTSLVLFFLIIAAIFTEVGQQHSVNFTISSSLFFALVAITPVALFMAVGAFTSQLMPTRSRAAGMAAGIFGASFLLRAAADSSSAHWLLNVTPLGWVERSQPLYGSQPIWLLPLFLLIAGLAAATVYSAGRRDLGASVFADHDTAEPRTGWLNGPLGVSFRLTRNTYLSWLAGVSLAAFFFGILTKSAAQAFESTQTAERAFSKITHINHFVGATAFLSIVFFMTMLLVMAFTASAVSAVREEEAEGYLDNLLVRPVSRLRWLGGRVLLIGIVIFLAGMLISAAAWAGESSQHAGITYHTMMLAGFNMMAPPVFALGVAIFALGLLPRFTSVIAYSVIAWSFLIQILSSGLNLSHWILDTSVFTHIALAPGNSPNWGIDVRLVAIGVALACVGAVAFNRRDLQYE